MTSFTEDMRRRGMVPGSRTLELTHDPAGPWLGRILHVSPSEPIVVVKRLRLADDETMAIETLHVRASLVPGLSADDLESHSFYTLLSDRYGIDIVGGAADDRADGDERGGVGGRSASRCTRRPSSSSGRLARARAGSSSTSARSIAATATGSSPSSTGTSAVGERSVPTGSVSEPARRACLVSELGAIGKWS